MEVYSHLLATLLLLSCFAHTCHGDVLFSTLPRTLVVSASPTEGTVLKVGEGSITGTWGLNLSFPEGIDASYGEVQLMLCYAPVSQKDRGWRKTVDKLSKDKTCQFMIARRTYTRNSQRLTWPIGRNIPTATYFIRAYAHDSTGKEVAYGQTTDAHKRINLFEIQAISGRHLSLDIVSICFSAFALLSVVGFFFVEKRDRSLAKK